MNRRAIMKLMFVAALAPVYGVPDPKTLVPQPIIPRPSPEQETILVNLGDFDGTAAKKGLQDYMDDTEKFLRHNTGKIT